MSEPYYICRELEEVHAYSALLTEVKTCNPHIEEIVADLVARMHEIANQINAPISGQQHQHLCNILATRRYHERPLF